MSHVAQAIVGGIRLYGLTFKAIMEDKHAESHLDLLVSGAARSASAR